MDKYAKLLKTKKTIWTTDMLRNSLGITNNYSLRNIFSRFKKKGLMLNVGYGLRTLLDFDKYELAAKLKKRSYISLETVLYKHGVIFQGYFHTITSISNKTFDKKIKDIQYEYKKIKDDILYNPIGIINNGNYMIATVERAICDRLYLSSGYYFDNLNNINRDRVIEIAKIYKNKRLLLDVEKIRNVRNSSS